MGKVKKYIVLALLSVFVAGSAVFSLASEKSAKPISLQASAIKAMPLLDPEELIPNSFKLPTPNPKINGRLNNLISRKPTAKVETGKLSITEMEYKALRKDKIRVIFSIVDGFNVNLAEIEARGGKILKERYNLVASEVPIDKIEDIVSNVDGIEYARLPQKFFPFSVTSEGVNLTGANNLHSAGFTGAGVKIAVVDVGFKGLTEAQSNGDIPVGVITHDYTGTGLQTQYKHGTACAEIVHDMAPDAELHLLKVSDEVDIYNALDYCVDNDINIITASIGTFGSGPGDGTGPLDEACNEARTNGILVVTAAGNEANFIYGGVTPVGTHWEGAFFDSDLDDCHEFIPGDSESWYNAIAAFPHQDDDGNPETNDVSIIMRWNDWPNASVDYDMYLCDYFTLDLVDYSNTIQNGSQPPLEDIVIDLPDSENYVHYYALIVIKKSGEPAGTEFELSLGGTSLFVPFYKYTSPIATSESSICEPADAQSVLAVGAIKYSNWTSGPQEDFSSQGPTNAWAGSSARIKPDICGPDGIYNNYSYNPDPFYGTSAATPHVAGAAALILEMHPYLEPADLQAVLESYAEEVSEDIVIGKDNIYGHGRLQVNYYNTAPNLNSIGNRTVNEGEELSFQISGSDPDNDPVTYSASNLPWGASFDILTRTFTWTPAQTQGGTTYTSVHFEISDGTETTPEDINITVNNTQSNSVIINEVLPHPGSGNGEWVELYNTSASPVDISGWFIKDESGHERPAGHIPTSTQIAGYGYYVIETNSGNGTLNDKGDTIYLMHSDGITVLDIYIYDSDIGIDISLAYDGATWSADTTPTQGFANSTTTDAGKSLISGYICDNSGIPLSGMNVWIAPYDGMGEGNSTSTQSNGYYYINNIDPAGDYRLGAGGNNGYYMKWYDDQIDYNSALHINDLSPNESRGGMNFILEQGGTISGNVYETDGSTAIEGEMVIAHQSDNPSIGFGTNTEADGSYTVTVPYGSYILTSGGWGDSDYTREIYEEHTNWDDADILIVNAGTNQTGIDFTLESATGTISGKVYDHNDSPIGNIPLWYESDLYDTRKNTTSNALDGTYSLSNLPRGLGEVCTEPDIATGYAQSFFDVYLDIGESLTGADIHLRQGALIQGRLTVHGDSSHPNDIDVGAYGGHFNKSWAESGNNGSGDGYYAMRLVPGNHTIRIDDFEHYIMWPQDITVANINDNQPNVNLTLYSTETDCVTISGTITGSAMPHTGSERIVAAFRGGDIDSYTHGDPFPEPLSIGPVAGDGTYQLPVIPNHNYDLIFGLFNENDESFETFTAIEYASQTVVNDNITGVNFDFSNQGGEITGTVTADGEPVLMAQVTIFNDTGDFAGFADTDQNGEYHLYNVPAGNYTAYGDHREYSLSTGVEATATDGATTSGVDIEFIPDIGIPPMITGDIDGNGKDEVIIDFGDGYGIWIRYNDSSWKKLHNLSPEFMITGDIDGNGKDEVIIDFGDGYGIWIRYNDSSWKKLHNLSPQRMVARDINNDGKDEITIDFGEGLGIWTYYPQTTSWSKLQSLSCKLLVVGDIDGNGQDDIIIDFDKPYGIWIRYNNSTWQKLNILSPEWMITGDMDDTGQDEVIIDFGDGYGIWVRYNDSTWTKLHNLSL